MPYTAPADRIDARRAYTSETVKNLRAENKRMSADNDRLREQNVALRIDLARATRGGRLNGTALSDIQIAATLLGELHDRLIGESRRTVSRAASAALLLAAREVSRTRDKLSQRGHADPARAVQEDHHVSQ